MSKIGEEILKGRAGKSNTLKIIVATGIFVVVIPVTAILGISYSQQNAARKRETMVYE